MKRGFSMIELIFVIVILGILASIALPKLAATRDDATASGIKSDIGTITQAIPALYLAQKQASITQAVPSLNSNTWNVVNADTHIQDKLTTTAGSCIEIMITDDTNLSTGLFVAGTSTSGPNLVIDMKGIATSTGVCGTLYDMGIRDQSISMQGASIVW